MAMAASITANDLLRAWDLGESQAPVERALTLLACANAAHSREELSLLTIGERDARLFDLREQLFGRTLRGFSECPACNQRLRFAADCSELRIAPSVDDRHAPFIFTFADWNFHLRLPNSRDLLAAAARRDLTSGRELLLERCILSASRGGEVFSPAEALGELSDDLITKLSSALAERDPQAEIILALNCPSCQHHFNVIFDIATFLWTELLTLAERLIEEVDALARTYGWSESEILAMPAARRRRYLRKVDHE